MTTTVFRLKSKEVEKYRRKKVDWGPLGYITYKRTYARQLDGNKTEEWWQTVQRVVEGCFTLQKRHCAQWHLPWNERQAQKSALTMYDLIFNFKFTPPGRGLWSMGTPFMFAKGSACLNNCGFVSTDSIDKEFAEPFVWTMDMSMNGVGVGFDTDGATKHVYLRKPHNSSDPHIIEDSREGWVAAFRRVLEAFSGRNTLPSEFDYSQIRPEGSPIKGFGGIAPGPEPLRKLIERTICYCKSYQESEEEIDSTFIVDMMNFAGAAVVAGGIRRTAEIAFGSPTDTEFLMLKEQSKIEDPELARWASNNSLIVKVGDKYEAAKLSAINGEPGFFWLENARAYGRVADGKTYRDKRVKGCNPCGEQSLESFELCNLVETFPSRHETLDDYLTTLKYAYMYAKTTTLLPTHDPRTNAVMFRNRRIGLSQSGIIENVNRIGFRGHIDWCEKGYQTVQHWDEIYSDWLCIPRSIKTTTVKPSGTVSLLPGATPGIHFPHSEYYIRRIRLNKTSPLVDKLKEAGYNVEADVYEKDQTVVAEFPVHEPHFDRRKDEISIWEQLELAAALQAKWADNQVSCTVTVRPEEAEELPRALTMYEKRLKAISFLPLRGDKVYKQAPYEAIDKEIYTAMASKLKPLKLDVTEQADRVVDKLCDGEICLI